MATNTEPVECYVTMDDTGEKRPNPDLLLQKIQSEGEAAGLGKLKIYLGMAAGVGKTFAMLTDAHELKRRGVDVVVGYVEPHGRRETELLLEGLEVIPKAPISFGGATLLDFDLDAALKRAPALIIVDELAHSNPPGARHPKRWQDIIELLKAGISVNTTVNIQHLESVKDVVSQITGVTVHETVPDTFFARADEIEVVDLTPNELIQRMREGKIYPQDRAQTALANFFKEGNLLALRELVLRHSARSVDAQIQKFRRQNEVRRIWPARERFLILLGPTPMAQALVRYAQRFATSLDAEISAITFETPNFARLNDQSRAYATDALRLAESLGCRTFIRPSQDMVADTVTFCHEHNITGIIVGKPVRPRWREFFRRNLVDELLRNAHGISVHVIGGLKAQPISSASAPSKTTGLGLKEMVETFAICALTTGISACVYASLDLANLIMIYLLGVTWIASRFNYREAVVGSILSVALFDFFFVPPRFTFSVSDGQYLITFGVMLGVSLLISRLAQQLKAQARETAEREQQTSALFAMGRRLLLVRNREELSSSAARHIARALDLAAEIVFPDEVIGQSTRLDSTTAHSDALALWVKDNNQPAGHGTDTLPGSDALYLPLGTAEACHAILKVKVSPDTPIAFRDRKLIEAYAAQLSLGLERLYVEDQAQAAVVSKEREQLKNVLLSSISHDLRTPLTVISGASTILLESDSVPRARQLELLGSIRDQAQRLSTIVRNVLDLTRIEAGEITIKRDWYSVEELIGAALRATRPSLGSRKVSVKIPDDLLLIKADGVLFEQVIVNILENVSKHTPLDSEVTISANSQNKFVTIQIDDTGPGFERDTETRVFDKLYTGTKSSRGGMGIGLTICRAIVKAHGGTIAAYNRPEGGARIEIKLPILDEDTNAV